MTLPVVRPEDVGFRPEGIEEVDRLLDGYLAAAAFPGGVAAVARDGRLAHLRAFGRLTYDAGAPAVETDTIYDLASLTKVVVTTTMAMILVDQGSLDLRTPVAAFLPGFKGGGRELVTVWHLLAHSSGLPAWAPLFQEMTGRQAFLRRIEATALAYEPGRRCEYSDLGFMLLGEVLERVAGEGLDVFARRAILGPLEMKDTLYRPGPELLSRIAPTERDPWRGRLLTGEVHDENAFAVGGSAPHAGLFGTAPDLASFAQMLLDGGVHQGKRLIARETIECFTRRAGVPGSSRALGWDTPAPGSSAGGLLSPESFGHTGFTGTSLWIDAPRRLFLILLTNRVHPTRANEAVPRVVRAAFAEAVIRSLARA